MGSEFKNPRSEDLKRAEIERLQDLIRDENVRLRNELVEFVQNDNNWLEGDESSVENSLRQIKMRMHKVRDNSKAFLRLSDLWNVSEG